MVGIFICFVYCSISIAQNSFWHVVRHNKYVLNEWKDIYNAISVTCDSSNLSLTSARKESIWVKQSLFASPSKGQMHESSMKVFHDSGETQQISLCYVEKDIGV